MDTFAEENGIKFKRAWKTQIYDALIVEKPSRSRYEFCHDKNFLILRTNWNVASVAELTFNRLEIGVSIKI
jgi:hypothetical protein